MIRHLELNLVGNMRLEVPKEIRNIHGKNMEIFSTNERKLELTKIPRQMIPSPNLFLNLQASTIHSVGNDTSDAMLER